MAQLVRMGAPTTEIERLYADFDRQIAEAWEGAVYSGGVWRSVGGLLLEVEVYPANAIAHRVFLDLAPYWEFPGSFGGRLCVPATDVESRIRMQVPKRLQRDTFERVDLMLRAAREKLQDALKAKK